MIRLLCFFLSIKASTLVAQSTTYYKNRALSREVDSEHSKYSKTVFQENGVVRTEIREMRSGKVIEQYAFKGKEPVGVWMDESTPSRSYDFALQYHDCRCSDSIDSIATSDPLQNNDSIDYRAPVFIAENASLYTYIAKHTYYPQQARDHLIEGRVFLRFELSSSGKVENVCVLRGVDPILDKEAMRVIRELPYQKAAELEGKPIGMCFAMPIKFRLR